MQSLTSSLEVETTLNTNAVDVLLVEANAGNTPAPEASAQKSSSRPSILGAMQRFIGLNTIEGVATTLYTLVEDAATVKKAVVWVGNGDATPVIQAGSQDDVTDALNELNSRGLLRKHLLDEFEKNRSPITLQLERGKQNPLGPLFRVLIGQKLVAFPIQTENGMAGTVVVSAASPEGISNEDHSFIEVLTYAAEQVLVHIPAATPSEDKKEDLEVILESIGDAVFIVDEAGTVKFCNPAFTRLTGIAKDKIHNQPYAALLDRLSEIATGTEDLKAQAQQVIDTLFDDTSSAKRVQIVLQNSSQVDIEFIAIDRQRKARWAGILREKTPPAVAPAAAAINQSQLLDLMLEQIRLPYTQVRSAIASLVEEHRHLNHREMNTFLRHIESNVENVKRMWDNFRGIYGVETDSLQLAPEDTNLRELVDQALSARPFNRHYRRFQINMTDKIPTLKLDAPRMEQTITNLLQSALDLAPADTPIVVDLKPVDGEVHLVIQSQAPRIAPDQVDKFFEPLFWLNSNDGQSGTGFSLYLSKQLVQQHGGRIWAESVSGQAVHITVALPEQTVIAEVKAPRIETVVSSVPAPSPAPIQKPEPATTPAAVRAPERGLQNIMIIRGQSDKLSHWDEKLRSEGYELLVYDSAETALSELALTRFDLVLLDAQLGEDEAESLEVCGWIRKQSEVPVIIIDETHEEAHQVEALNRGADDYIVQSISDDEFLARVNVIFKRQHIAARTREPMEVGDIRIDFARREVTLSGKPVKLTRIQYELLYTLAVNREQVLTHKQLLEKVWGPEYQGETQYLWVNISRLRKKLEPDMNNPCYIQNVPGIGYMFKG